MTMNTEAYSHIRDWIDETGKPYQIVPSSLADLGVPRTPDLEECYDPINADLAKEAKKGRRIRFSPTIDSRCQYGLNGGSPMLWAVKEEHWEEYATWARAKGLTVSRDDPLYMSMSIYGTYVLPARGQSKQPSTVTET